MQIQAIQGYFNNGIFYQQGRRVALPEHKMVIINVLDVPIDIHETKQDIHFLEEFEHLAKEIEVEEKAQRAAWLKELNTAISMSMYEELPDMPRSTLMREPIDLAD